MNQSLQNEEMDAARRRLYTYILTRVKNLFSSLRQTIVGREPTYDEEYLTEITYEYIYTYEADNGDFRCRCNLCGLILGRMPDAIEHVASHDEQVGESINPFETEPHPAKLISDPVKYADRQKSPHHSITQPLNTPQVGENTDTFDEEEFDDTSVWQPPRWGSDE